MLISVRFEQPNIISVRFEQPNITFPNNQSALYACSNIKLQMFHLFWNTGFSELRILGGHSNICYILITALIVSVKENENLKVSLQDKVAPIILKSI
jgi:hypothetical protein